MKWIGPIVIGDLLEGCLDASSPKPPEKDGVYLSSEKAWNGEPNPGCVPLYVGSNTGRSRGFGRGLET